VIRQTALYVVDGVRVPSVSEILKVSGMTDYSMVPPDVLENARRRGQAVDEWLTALDEGLIDQDHEPDPEIAGYVRGYKRFLRESDFKVEKIQTPMVSREWRFAGTSDRWGQFISTCRRSVLDIKCVARMMPETKAQLAGYALLAEPMLPRAYKIDRWALRLTPEGSFELRHYTDRSDFDDFIAALRITVWKMRERGLNLDQMKEAA
jgi:hypothetical protein